MSEHGSERSEIVITTACVGEEDRDGVNVMVCKNTMLTLMTAEV